MVILYMLGKMKYTIKVKKLHIYPHENAEAE